jgi:hypothetical protein
LSSKAVRLLWPTNALSPLDRVWFQPNLSRAPTINYFYLLMSFQISSELVLEHLRIDLRLGAAFSVRHELEARP